MFFALPVLLPFMVAGTVPRVSGWWTQKDHKFSLFRLSDGRISAFEIFEEK